MSVAVSLNLSDGVILGVDSAISIPDPSGRAGIAKVYEHAEKLFQLANLPIGVAIFGLAALKARSIGSYLHEFELKYNYAVGSKYDLKSVVENLRNFFFDKYNETIVPEIQEASGKKFDEIPPERRPILGLVVGGFSDEAYLSEVWRILIPMHNTPESAELSRKQGDFGSNWFAMFAPIQRYIKGWDMNLFEELSNYFITIRGSNFTQEELNQIRAILAKYEYQIPFAAMPIEEGINHVRFLVELVTNHYRFTFGAPIVGGKANIGKVTYKEKKFEILKP